MMGSKANRRNEYGILNHHPRQKQMKIKTFTSFTTIVAHNTHRQSAYRSEQPNCKEIKKNDPITKNWQKRKKVYSNDITLQTDAELQFYRTINYQ